MKLPLRLLLVTVAASASLLTVRLGALWQGIGAPVGLSVAEVQAAAPEAGKSGTAGPGPMSEAAPAEPAKAGATADQKTQSQAEPAKAAAAPDATPAAAMPPAAPPPAGAPTAAAPSPAAPPGAGTPPPTPEPTPPPAGGAESAADDGATSKANEPADLDTMSDAELTALQDLAKRREELDRRERALDTRAGVLEAGEKRLDEKLTELKDLQSKIQGLLKQYDDQEKGDLKSLVKIYENMKPKDAAPIFEKLDMDVLLNVIEGMKEAKVAPILAKMDPAKAKQVTDELAQRHQISQALKKTGI
jgi:flagellar motility protein MotE (MotC chaperone)